MEPILHTCGPIPPPQLHLNLWVSADIIYLLLLHLNLRYYSAFLPHLNLGLSFSADIPLLSGIHIKQLSPTFTWHSFRRLSSHLYLWLYCCICPHLYLALFHHISRWHLLRGGPFLHPPLLVTFTFHLLSYYSTLMCHFPRASPRSISTLLNMVSFSLFLSHLYMTLILFITPRQYYSPQLLQGFSAEDFTLSLISPLPWVLHSPQLFRGGFSHHFLLSTGSFSHLSLAFLQ